MIESYIKGYEGTGMNQVSRGVNSVEFIGYWDDRLQLSIWF